MQIAFHLSWMKKLPVKKAFKHAAAYQLFNEYTGRIAKFCRVQIQNSNSLDKEGTGRQTWLCSTEPSASMLSSKNLARRLDTLRTQSVKELRVVIGGPDGFNLEEKKSWAASLEWNFGPLTFPHELAAVIASEQIYRAMTIIHQLPYHEGH